jgi:arylsulfatase A-like enzyme
MFEPDGTSAVPRGFGSAAEVFAIRDGTRQLDARERESLIARYDGEIRFLSDEIGRLVAEMEAAGLWDDTVVVVAADHGEEFWDHGGFEHGHTHHHELLRVPLIVRDPGGPRGVVRDGRVRLLDVVPRVLASADLDVPGELPGRGLGDEAAPHAVAEGSLWAGDLVSVRSDGGTVMLHRERDAAVYYRPDDPREERPLPVTGSGPQELLSLLESLPPARTRGDEPWTPDAEQLERLRSLGYAR